MHGLWKYVIAQRAMMILDYTRLLSEVWVANNADAVSIQYQQIESH